MKITNIKLGFFCSTADSKLNTNRKFRISNLNLEKVIQTLEANIKDFLDLLDISLKLGCGIFRLGSNFIPFASHKSFKKEWFKIIEERLLDLRKILKTYPIRITMHPGQFVVLSSPKKEVVSNSLRELEYHFWLLDTLGIDKEGIIVIHVGGVFEGKKGSIERFREVIYKNPWLLHRIAVENDERHYSVEDLLQADLPIPIVYDHYHHILNPSNFDIEKLFKSWGSIVPEFHLSSKPEEAHIFGKHGDWINPEDFLNFLNTFKERRIDLIIEAKKKEKAIQKLLSDLKKNYGISL